MDIIAFGEKISKENLYTLVTLRDLSAQCGLTLLFIWDRLETKV